MRYEVNCEIQSSFFKMLSCNRDMKSQLCSCNYENKVEMKKLSGNLFFNLRWKHSSITHCSSGEREKLAELCTYKQLN